MPNTAVSPALAAAQAAFDALQQEIQNSPGSEPDYAAGTRYALDFNNSAAGEPYLFDTDYRFETEQDAEAYADRVLPRIDQAAKDLLAASGVPVADNPGQVPSDLDWRTYAVITSERRDPHEYARWGESASPAVERNYPGPFSGC